MYFRKISTNIGMDLPIILIIQNTKVKCNSETIMKSRNTISM